MVNEHLLPGLAQRTEIADGCHIWIGARQPRGYGMIYDAKRRRHVLAHRTILEIKLNRVLLKSELACHTCDVRHCVNPDHLYAGSPSTNMQDMWDRKRHPTRQSKFSSYQVASVRNLYPQYNQRELSEIFNISRQQISRIVRNETRY